MIRKLLLKKRTDLARDVKVELFTGTLPTVHVRNLGASTIHQFTNHELAERFYRSQEKRLFKSEVLNA